MLPMIGFLIQAFFGHEVQRIFGQKTGRQIMGAIATLVVAAAFLVTIPMVMTLASFGGSTRQIVVPIGNWITTGTVKMPFELMVDPLSLT
ncbi:MAG: hypothetical protein POG24_11190, partial [Acidocella sp.]|nr:hypothetical protein [Acidocella sp.]